MKEGKNSLHFPEFPPREKKARRKTGIGSQTIFYRRGHRQGMAGNSLRTVGGKRGGLLSFDCLARGQPGLSRREGNGQKNITIKEASTSFPVIR